MKLLSPTVVVYIGVFFTSFSAIFVRSTEAPAVVAAMYRMWFSVFLLLPVLAGERIRAAKHRGRGLPVSSAAEPHTPGPALSDWFLCLASGLFLGAHFWVWFESLALTSITSSTVLVNTHPIFVLIFGFLLLREKVSLKAVMFVVIAVAGMVTLSFGDFVRGVDTLAGDLLAIVSAAAVSGYFLIGRKVRRRMGAPLYAVSVYFIAAASLTVLTLAGGISLFDYSLKDYLMFLGMAFFCTLLGHTLFNWALKYLKTSFISTAVLLEPVFATLLGMIIFAEYPGVITILGGAVVLFGILMFVREEGKLIAPKGDRTTRAAAIAEGIRSDIPVSKEMRMLDFGAGSGLLSVELAQYVGSVLAIDTSKIKLEELEAKTLSDPTLQQKITVTDCDIQTNSLANDVFDLVVSSMALHHVERIETTLDRLADLTKPGGFIAVADLEPEDGSFHGPSLPVAHHGFDPIELSEMLAGRGFGELYWRRVFSIERGKRSYPVFLLTGRKA